MLLYNNSVYSSEKMQFSLYQKTHISLKSVSYNVSVCVDISVILTSELSLFASGVGALFTAYTFVIQHLPPAKSSYVQLVITTRRQMSTGFSHSAYSCLQSNITLDNSPPGNRESGLCALPRDEKLWKLRQKYDITLIIWSFIYILKFEWCF